MRRPAGRERGPAAAGHGGEADRVSVDHLWEDVLGRYTQHFGSLHRNGGPRTPDIGRALHQMHGAVRVDIQGAAGFETHVEPEAKRHAASAVRSPERGAVVRMVPDRFQHLRAADAAELGAVRAARPFPGSIAEPELDRVEAELAGDLVNNLLGGERRLRRPRSPVGRAAGLVHDHVVALDRHVLAVVRREDAHGARRDERARIRARLVGERRLHGLNSPVVRGPDLDPQHGFRRSGRYRERPPRATSRSSPAFRCSSRAGRRQAPCTPGSCRRTRRRSPSG